MTQLEALLERAADDRPLAFDRADVARRVQRRRRTRRSLLGAAVVLVVALSAVAVASRDRSRETLASAEERAVVGLWTGIEVDGQTWEDRLAARLAELDSDIAAQRDVVDRAEGTDREIQSQVLLQLLQERNAVQTSSDPWSAAHLELRPDGTLSGDDGCNAFAGHWRIEHDRLVADDLVGTKSRCGGDDGFGSSRTQLQEALTSGAAVSTADGALTLTAPAVTIRFLDRDATVESELQVPLEGGGTVEVTFRTPRSLDAGAERTVATWTAVSSGDQEVTLWVRVEERDCGLHADENVIQVEPRSDVRGPIDDRAEVDGTCRGDRALTLTAQVGDESDSTRVPITIR